MQRSRNRQSLMWLA